LNPLGKEEAQGGEGKRCARQEVLTLETLKEWLVEGVENPGRLEEVKFVVVEENRRDGKLESFRAISPSIPVRLLVADLGDQPIPAFRVAIETDIATVDMEPQQKLKAYRALLLASRLPLVKVYVYTHEHLIALAVDLDKRSLSRREFNDAIAALAMAYNYIIREMGLEREAGEEALRNLEILAAAQLREGRSREEVEDMLLRAGIPKSIARQIIDSIYGEQEKIRREGFYT
jgi:hypothetical protein